MIMDTTKTFYALPIRKYISDNFSYNFKHDYLKKVLLVIPYLFTGPPTF